MSSVDIVVPATRADSTDYKSNKLIAAMPHDVIERLAPYMERVDLSLGTVVYEPGVVLDYVYFPTTSIISLLYVMDNGESAEIAIVGKDGMVGIALFMGGQSTSSRAVVQNAGEAYRLQAQALKDEFNRAGPMMHLLLRFTQALVTQMVQTAACNRHHDLDKQLCRWLLMSLDQLETDELVMTQQLIANMMGVSWEGVTVGVEKLQKAGLIHYARGRIEVLDRLGLEHRSCECYAVVKRETDRLLPERLAVGSREVDFRPSTVAACS